MGFQISLIVKWFNIQDDLGPLRWPPPLLLLLFGRLGFSGFSCNCGANILRIIVRIRVKHATEIVRIRTIIGLGFSFCCDYGCVAHSQTFNCNELGLGAGIESLDVVVVSCVVGSVPNTYTRDARYASSCFKPASLFREEKLRAMVFSSARCRPSSGRRGD